MEAKGDSMKNKGFTLIEVIAAVAILAISIISITMAVSLAINIRTKADIKLSTMYYSQGISEAFKAAGPNKWLIDPSNSLSTANSSYFAYFDENYNNFVIYSSSGLITINNPSNPVNFTDWFSNGPFINGTVCSPNDDYENINQNLFANPDSTVNSCSKIYNFFPQIKGRKYGAYIIIEQDTRAATSGAHYLKVKVWNMQYGLSSESERELYIGRW